MKKFRKVIPIIIAFIIGISTTVTAATVFNSKDITYSSSSTTKKNVKDSLDELYTKASKIGQCPEGYVCYKPLADQVKIGDYISMTPASTNYTITTSTTGYTSTQTINPSELNLWRVISKNEDGTVDIVSDKVSSTGVYFQGKTGYINFIKGLNTIAAQYTDGKHVERTRHIGYSNQTETIASTSKLEQTTVPWAKTTSSTTGWTGCSGSNYLCGTDEDLGAGDVGYETDYNLVKAVYGSMKANNSEGNSGFYWLSSRIFWYQTSSRWQFRVQFVTGTGARNAYWLYTYDTKYEESGSSYSVRPIITLRSNTVLASGSGTSSSPYKLK